MPFLMPSQKNTMRITVTIDNTLYQQAIELADHDMDEADLFTAAIQTFVRVQAAKRLAALGGAQPGMADIPRERTHTPQKPEQKR
jgi:hypothetical protein